MSRKKVLVGLAVALVLALVIAPKVLTKSFLKKTFLQNYLYGYEEGFKANCADKAYVVYSQSDIKAAEGALQRAMDAYLQRVQKMRAGDTSIKLILFKGENGYGNRLPGMVFAFVLSLLTERVVVSTVQADEPDFSALWDSKYIMDARTEPWAALVAKPGASRASYRAQSNEDPAAMDWIFKEDIRGKFTQDVIEVASTDNPFPVLYMTTKHQAWLKELLGQFGAHGQGIFGWFLPRLMQPSAKVRARMEPFAAKHFPARLRPAPEAMFPKPPAGDDEVVIGIHVRAKKRVEFGFDGDVLKQFAYAAMVADASYPGRSARFFLATDSRWVREACTAYFGERCFFWPEFGLDVVGMTQDVSRVPANFELAAIDLVLLSRCDEVIHTFASTFAVAAAGLTGRVTHVVGPEQRYSWTAAKEPCFWGFPEFAAHLGLDLPGQYATCNPYFLYHSWCVFRGFS
eukprot:tig00001052_g6611.t1